MMPGLAVTTAGRRPTQQRADDRSGALGLLFCQEAGVSPGEDDPANLPGDTRAGEIELQIPKIRQGSYFRSILEPRRRAEQALLAVVEQAYVAASPRGASTS